MIGIIIFSVLLILILVGLQKRADEKQERNAFLIRKWADENNKTKEEKEGMTHFIFSNNPFVVEYIKGHRTIKIEYPRTMNRAEIVAGYKDVPINRSYNENILTIYYKEYAEVEPMEMDGYTVTKFEENLQHEARWIGTSYNSSTKVWEIWAWPQSGSGIYICPLTNLMYIEGGRSRMERVTHSMHRYMPHIPKCRMRVHNSLLIGEWRSEEYKLKKEGVTHRVCSRSPFVVEYIDGYKTKKIGYPNAMGTAEIVAGYKNIGTFEQAWHESIVTIHYKEWIEIEPKEIDGEIVDRFHDNLPPFYARRVRVMYNISIKKWELWACPRYGDEICVCSIDDLVTIEGGQSHTYS